MLSVTSAGSESFFFIVPKDEGCSKPQLQVRSGSVYYIDGFFISYFRYLFLRPLPTPLVLETMAR